MLSAFQGLVASAVPKLVGAPFSRVLVLQQTGKLAGNEAAGEEGVGALQVAQAVLREEGVLGFWRGVESTVITWLLPTKWVQKVTQKYIKSLIPERKRPSFEFIIFRGLAVGIGAGVAVIVAVYPLDVLYTQRLATPLGKRETLAQSVRSFLDGGVAHVYSGLLSSVLGSILYRVGYFFIYDGIRSRTPNDSFWSSSRGKKAVGYFVTIVAGLLTYPFSTVQRQCILTGAGELAAIMDIHQRHGIAGFFTGFTTNLLRTVATTVARKVYGYLFYPPQQPQQQPREQPPRQQPPRQPLAQEQQQPRN